MKKIFKLLKWLIISIYVVSGILLAVFLWPHSGWRVYRVVTGSMTPAIPQGSLVVDHAMPPRNYQIGQVVTFISPYNTKETITHRIVGRGVLGAIPTFVTKGDANNTPDRPIVGGNIVGRVVWHVPYAGRALGWLKIPAVFIGLIIIPALFIVFDEVRVLIRAIDGSQPGDRGKRDKSEHDEPPRSGGSGDPDTRRPPPRAPAPHQPARKRRSVDTIARHATVLILVGFFGISATYAKLTTHATLTNNSITTATLPVNGHCPPGTTIVHISNTGPGSHIHVTIINICVTSITNINNININNSNNQTVTSGDASSSGNTNGGSASSGSTSASNSTNTTVTVPPAAP